MKPLACAVLLAVTLAGCAVGRVRTPAGAEVSGLALGHARVEFVALVPAGDTVGPPAPVDTARIEGGSLSSNFTEVVSLLASGAVALFGHLAF